jgi:hypothetical protein
MRGNRGSGSVFFGKAHKKSDHPVLPDERKSMGDSDEKKGYGS